MWSTTLGRLVSIILFISTVLAAPTCNTPSNRACWTSTTNINTDYEVTTPFTGVTRTVCPCLLRGNQELNVAVQPCYHGSWQLGWRWWKNQEKGNACQWYVASDSQIVDYSLHGVQVNSQVWLHKSLGELLTKIKLSGPVIRADWGDAISITVTINLRTNGHVHHSLLSFSMLTWQNFYPLAWHPSIKQQHRRRRKRHHGMPNPSTAIKDLHLLRWAVWN